MKITRRALVDRAFKGSLLYLAYNLGGASVLLTPREASARNVPLAKLSALQARQLEVLADAILPGSVADGVVHFIDHELNADPNEAMLIAKYFQVALPYVNFYARGLEVASSMSRASLEKPLEALDSEEAGRLVGEMAVPGAVVEQFPIFLFYMCLRSDAVDVSYGTPEGFKKLNIPYMEHILPPEGWDA